VGGAEAIGETVGVVEVEGLGLAGLVGGVVEGGRVDPPAFAVLHAVRARVFHLVALGTGKVEGGEAARVGDLVGGERSWEDLRGGFGHGEVDLFSESWEGGARDLVEEIGLIFIADEVT
jgi:hypothetical protein